MLSRPDMSFLPMIVTRRRKPETSASRRETVFWPSREHRITTDVSITRRRLPASSVHKSALGPARLLVSDACREIWRRGAVPDFLPRSGYPQSHAGQQLLRNPATANNCGHCSPAVAVKGRPGQTLDATASGFSQPNRSDAVTRHLLQRVPVRGCRAPQQRSPLRPNALSTGTPLTGTAWAHWQAACSITCGWLDI